MTPVEDYENTKNGLCSSRNIPIIYFSPHFLVSTSEYL